MRWVALFGGIAACGLVLHALLGRWLWHRARGLLAELDGTAARLDGALRELERASEAAHPASSPLAARRAGEPEEQATGAGPIRAVGSDRDRPDGPAPEH